MAAGTRSRGLTVLLALALAGLTAPTAARAYGLSFCGYLVAPGQLCGGSGYHPYNLVSNRYPSSGTLYRLCVTAITDAGNFKAVRNGTTICAANANYHYACFLPAPYSKGVVYWNSSGATGAYHTLNGFSTTTGAGC